MKLIELLTEVLPPIGGWPKGCVAISLFSSGQIWPHSKMPTRYRPVMGVWTDDTFWGNTTAGFYRPLFTVNIEGSAGIKPVTKHEYDEAIAKALGETK